MTLESFLRSFGDTVPHGAFGAVLGIAFLGGIIASAVCPCTLPVGLGMAGVVGTSETRSRRSGFAIATAFFAGIVVNLTVLGALAGRLGVVMTESFGRYWALAMAVVRSPAFMWARPQQTAWLGRRTRAPQPVRTRTAASPIPGKRLSVMHPGK